MNRHRLPKTDSIQELAEFWGTHNVTEFEDELEEVGERVFERENEITIRLKTSDMNVLHELARSRCVKDAELIREWVLERIHAT